MDLTRRTALVTGAASGLGRTLAQHLAARCAVIWVTDLREDALSNVVSEVEAAGAQARPLALDVTSWQDWEEARDTIGPVDLVVNNAGVADVGPLIDTEPHQWQRQLDINVMGVVRGSRTFVPGMIQAGRGHVLNIASMAGLAQTPGSIAYNTAKAAVVAFSESLRVEVALDGVGVTVACPEFFPTNLTDSMAGASPQTVARIQRWMERSGVTADDVARACLDAVQRDRFLVLTHKDSWKYWLLKRVWPERYRKMLLDRERARRAKKAASRP